MVTASPAPSLRVTATLGPASTHETIIRALARVACRFRLNASHLDAQALHTWLTRLVGLADAGMPRREVVIDLQGAKMRLGRLSTPRRVEGEVQLVPCASSDEAGVLPVPHPELFSATRKGERLSADDGRVILRLLEDPTPQGVRALVERGGMLSSHKGINRADHPVPYAALGSRDRRAIEVGEAFTGLDISYAFSFVHTGEEARLLCGLTSSPLVAKIERPEAFAHLDAIEGAFDELWLCRGDLGAQAGLLQLGPLQERFVQWMQTSKKPAILAGEVLGHLSVATEPTRSEVVHLYQTQRDGFAGIVLSDETAVGQHPLEVARVLEQLCGLA
ncbi:MAG: hypothetical protein JRH20_19075 [Deltaproteobacteria bacterium]|nr:hypothetical protein [Deltaproteobacteria bacterium]